MARFWIAPTALPSPLRWERILTGPGADRGERGQSLMPPTQGRGRQAPLPWATFRGPLQGQKPAGASAIQENPPCSAEYMGHAQPSPRRGALSHTYEPKKRQLAIEAPRAQRRQIRSDTFKRS